MVHSGSASPMKTAPSASSHLCVPASAPLVPPPEDQELTQTPAKLLTPDLNSNSDQTKPSTLTPVDVEASAVTVKALACDSPELLVHTPASDNAPINGRTSGRKRTPKACDCCGPNGTGHNVKTSAKGRGSGRGKGRGRGGASIDLMDTPKRKAGGQLTRIKHLDFKEKTEEAEDEGDGHEKAQVPLIETDTKAQTVVMPRVTIRPREVLLRDIFNPVKDDVKERKEDIDGSGGESRDVEMRLSDTEGLGSPEVQGRWSAASKTGDGIKRGSFSGIFLNPRTYGRPRIVGMQKPGQNNDAGIFHREQTDHSSNKSALGNGDTVNLSDTEPEEDYLIVGEMTNGLTSVSKQSGSPLDLDSEMQVDQAPDKTDSVSIAGTLSNGNAATPTKEDNCSTLMQVETSLPPKGAPPPESPITMCSTEHPGALRDHWLYCQTGTWEKDKMEEVKSQSGETDRQEKDEKMQNEESLEQLIDMVHEFLENFYLKYGGFIPLSETDVLEYLKKRSSDSDLSNRGLDIKGQMTRYRAALASAPIAGFTVMYNKHNLSLEDLGTLEEQNWLNDQIINMYGELIMEATQHKVHFFNSFFHKQLVAKGYDGVKRWTKKVDLFSKWLLLIPIHLEIHWSLITVTMATKTISYYDSQGIVFRHTTDNIMKYLLSEAKEKKQAAFQKGWKITIIKGIPQQKNDSDCGVFVLEYCRCLSVKQPLLFSQEDMPRIRKRIYKELCDCRLND